MYSFMYSRFPSGVVVLCFVGYFRVVWYFRLAIFFTLQHFVDYVADYSVQPDEREQKEERFKPVHVLGLPHLYRFLLFLRLRFCFRIRFLRHFRLNANASFYAYELVFFRFVNIFFVVFPVAFTVAFSVSFCCIV